MVRLIDAAYTNSGAVDRPAIEGDLDVPASDEAPANEITDVQRVALEAGATRVPHLTIIFDKTFAGSISSDAAPRR